MDRIRQIAEAQFENIDSKDNIGFGFKGQYIINPWVDPSGRFELTTEEAVKVYGDKFFRFIDDIADRYGIHL